MTERQRRTYRAIRRQAASELVEQAEMLAKRAETLRAEHRALEDRAREFDISPMPGSELVGDGFTLGVVSEKLARFSRSIRAKFGLSNTKGD